MLEEIRQRLPLGGGPAGGLWVAMPVTRVPTPLDLPPILERLAGTRAAALLLFFGSEDQGTGLSWCPDCVTADPVLRRACRTLQPVLELIECPVGQRSAWKNQPEHPYRLHPLIRLARIPTLIWVDGACERGRLVEADCAMPAIVEAFLRAPAAASAPPAGAQRQA